MTAPDLGRGDAARLQGKRCELCNREWFYLVVSRDDLPDFCKECKATYLALRRASTGDDGG